MGLSTILSSAAIQHDRSATVNENTKIQLCLNAFCCIFIDGVLNSFVISRDCAVPTSAIFATMPRFLSVFNCLQLTTTKRFFKVNITLKYLQQMKFKQT